MWNDSVLEELMRALEYRVVGTTYSERTCFGRKTKHYYFDARYDHQRGRVISHDDDNLLHVHSCRHSTRDKIVKDIHCYH